jgi:hypothetical protein
VWIELAINFSKTKWENTLLIIYYPFTDSRLNLINILLADLELETEIEDPNEGAKMFIVALLRKATLKRDHTDHIEDMKDEQSFAGLGIDTPNDEGIVFVAFAEVAPMTCQISGFRMYG